MKKVVAAVAAACVCLTAAAVATAGLNLGVVDDAGKYANPSDPVFKTPADFFANLNDAGLTVNRVTVLWDPAAPTTIQDQTFLDNSLPAAKAKNVRIVLSVYPKTSLAFATGDGSAPLSGDALAAQVNAFANYLKLLAQRYDTPQYGVKDFIVGNEQNQPRFLRPQFNADCTNASGAVAEAVQAAGYKALKSVDGSINVIGLGLSPRGNDNCKAANNISTSPVRFITAFCKAYKASPDNGQPIMDSIGFHPYPNVNTDKPSLGYQWPNAGIPTSDRNRIKQAFVDSCGGFGPFAGGALKWVLDEVGYQVSTSVGGYTGAENVPLVDEPTQAAYYEQLLGIFACDPSVTDVYLFHLIDEDNLDRFQSGLERVDGSHRPSYDKVQAIAKAGGPTCSGAQDNWAPATTVIGASASLDPGNTWRITAQEDADYKVALFRLDDVGGTLTPAQVQAALGKAASTVRAAAPVVVTTKTGLLPAYRNPPFSLVTSGLAPGTYAYGAVLSADLGPSRATVLTSDPFDVGGGAPSTGGLSDTDLNGMANGQPVNGNVQQNGQNVTLKVAGIPCPSTVVGACTITAAVTGTLTKTGFARATTGLAAKPKPKSKFAVYATAKTKVKAKAKLTTIKFKLPKGFKGGRVFIGFKVQKPGKNVKPTYYRSKAITLKPVPAPKKK
jgi:hypothetical protein